MDTRMYDPKFRVGQMVKSILPTKFRGVIIKVIPKETSRTYSEDMYVVKIKEDGGRRETITESLLELDEMLMNTKINGIDVDVAIGDALYESDFKPQFEVGDYVITPVEEKRARVTKFLENKDANALGWYEVVTDDGEIKKILETLLLPYDVKQTESLEFIDVPFTEVRDDAYVEKENEIRKKSEKILEFLGITSSKNQFIQLENAMKIHKYISQNSSYTQDVMQEKADYKADDVYLNELYNGLINRRGVCTTDAIIFKHLLSQIDMCGDVVILQSKESGVHAATLVQLGNEAYYFDTTLERTIFEQLSNNSEKFVFCCAALGQEEYSKFYTSVGVLPENLNEDLLPMPVNIPKESVPKIIIQSVGNEIQDLTFDENTIDAELEMIDAPINEKDKLTNVVLDKIQSIKDVVKEDGK